MFILFLIKDDNLNYFYLEDFHPCLKALHSTAAWLFGPHTHTDTHMHISITYKHS